MTDILLRENSMRSCLFYNLGLTEYGEALALQEGLHEARKSGAIPDVLLLVEHPPVITLGRHASIGNIIASQDILAREGIAVFHTGRGGDVTFHGPGQLVAYPILNLKENGLTVTSYVWKLEETAIRTLMALGIKGERVADWRGVFVGGVSLHGLALNVNTDLKYFDYIIPCGLTDIKVTSIARIKGQKIDMPTVGEIMLAKFADVFGFVCSPGEEAIEAIKNVMDRL
jgi:lipoyl(octanoyl) transferase